MRVNRLTLRNFRNYVNLELDFIANINIFIGENAQGKTNILESLFIGSFARSHRTSTDDDLIGWDYPRASVDIFFTRQGVDNKLSFRLVREQKKEILLNDFAIKPRDVIGSLTTVLFSPEDLWLIKGAPGLRRRFIDIEISQAVPAYYRHLLQYNRVLNQRNHLLKKIREKRAGSEQLEAWDEQLAKTAAFLVNKRVDALKKLGMLANLMQRKITASKENLSITYSQVGTAENGPIDNYEWFRENLITTRQADIFSGSTSLGPHRDDVIFKVNGRDLRNFGSQGQQRTGILALKLAELEFLKSETGEYPVLLLDDVMSELDSQRREQLLLFIRDRIQTFITATDAALFPTVKIGQYYRVSGGTVLE
ncbi:MAG: DNA replication/repair protein RecF [Negativicutes bacterium]|nr:DNA replication/repair protein RecF [Negativicutes bacterium]